MATPLFSALLPDLWRFVGTLAESYTSGALDGWPAMRVEVLRFFSPAMMDLTEGVIPGWRRMSSYTEHQTLIHVTAVLTSFVLLPAYQRASPDHQNLMLWTGLFHDLAKEAQPDKRDHGHAFRSAAVTGLQLPNLGFAFDDDSHLAAWADFTRSAMVAHPDSGELIQDNSRLPAILSGIHQIFGEHSPAALIVKAVLLHMSVNVLRAWPQSAPLAGPGLRQIVDAPLLPLLRAMMMADNDAWAFFDADLKAREGRETWAVFEEIARFST